MKIYLNKLDRGDSGDDQGWGEHRYGEQCRKNLYLHTVPCLHYAGSWLGCIWSGSNLQPPLLCSPSFSGLFNFTSFMFTNLFQVNVTNIKEKLVVSVFGHKIHLVNCSVEWRFSLDESDDGTKHTDEGDRELTLRCEFSLNSF